MVWDQQIIFQKLFVNLISGHSYTNIISVALRLWNTLPNQIKGTLTMSPLNFILKQCFGIVLLVNYFCWINPICVLVDNIILL